MSEQAEPVCHECGELFAWNENADRDAPPALLFCNRCAQTIAVAARTMTPTDLRERLAARLCDLILGEGRRAGLSPGSWKGYLRLADEAISIVTLDRYPRGKLNEHDEGSLDVVIGIKDGAVIVAFPKPINWIGLGYDDAIALADLIAGRAAELKAK